MFGKAGTPVHVPRKLWRKRGHQKTNALLARNGDGHTMLNTMFALARSRTAETRQVENVNWCPSKFPFQPVPNNVSFRDPDSGCRLPLFHVFFFPDSCGVHGMGGSREAWTSERAICWEGGWLDGCLESCQKMSGMVQCLVELVFNLRQDPA